MLVLSRKRNEALIIDTRKFGLPPIKIVVVEIRGDKVRLGIAAPEDVPVHRLEVFEAIEKQREEAKVN